MNEDDFSKQDDDSSSSACVSVVIPCYNAGEYVAKAVNSVRSQTWTNHECIVVDDGSDANTQKVLDGLRSDCRVIRQSNSGVAAARNRGIEAARGEYFAFLDADDWWHEEFLENMVHGLEGTSAAPLAYCGWQNVGLTGPRGESFIPPDYEEMPDRLARIFQNTRWPIHGALVRRSTVEKVGSFDGRWTPCEDFAFWLEATLLGPLVRVPLALAYYRHHGDTQLSANKARLAVKHWEAQRNFLSRHPEIGRMLGGRRATRKLMYGELLRRANEIYWRGELEGARKLFRIAMRHGYGSARDWMRMLPSFAPISIHRSLISSIHRVKRLSGANG